MSKPLWTINADIDARLRELWLRGLSSSSIAKELNKEYDLTLTRNAVIGRLHRSGMKHVKREKVKVKVEPVIREYKTKALPEYVAPPPPPKPPVFKATGMVSIANLHDNICHFLMDGAKYCGRVVQVRSAYCAHHHDLMHVKADKRK